VSSCVDDVQRSFPLIPFSMVTFSLSVFDPDQEGRAEITFIDRRGNDTTITIEYYPTLFSIHEDYFDFGRLPLGESKTHRLWIVNDSKFKEFELSELKLKSGDQGFEIIDGPTENIFPPASGRTFTVKFTGTEKGNFSDSIGVGDSCIFQYSARIEASVGAPRIIVGRCYFGDVTVDNSKFGMVTVQNIGSSALEIYEYTGPRLDPVFEVTDWTEFNEFEAKPTYQYPWKIQPGVEKVFEVKFTPDAEGYFSDSVVFISNTERPDGVEIDSVGELNGTGIKAYLVANGYNWLRRRIDRPGTFDVAPYPVDPPDQVILIENSGSTPVGIKNIIIKEDIKGEAFIFEKSVLVNLYIDSQSNMYVPVQFHPVVTGVHRLRFQYNNTAASPTETILNGIGIVPRVEADHPSFGQTEVMASEFLSQTMKIVNLSRTEWEYCDSVTITDLTISQPGEIATSISADVFGSKGFRFDIDALRVMSIGGEVKSAATGLPIVLQPGDYIEVDGEFRAPEVGLFKATITTVSDAETEATSVWTGGDLSTAVSDRLSDYPNIKLMPSPVQDILIIQNKGAALTTDKITIIDLNGRCVIDEKINILQGRYDINTSALVSGVYILRIHAGDRVISEKFTVAR
nr:T9SS type A sorting domain-containing protein [Candidatus Kapabacteria bacterium]